ncbi:hypothetical protein COLO4_20519 [Corchorus olitorius]|uniref:KANL2-like probable zinc-finger domain-containing protein n=1 Tax=Corchorus olitorius TaxID=93759 RepID=A0A1R3IZF5_9ROSI|nr:hypothetical protein COLO4_20519 [Corchorus olitorius]
MCGKSSLDDPMPVEGPLTAMGDSLTMDGLGLDVLAKSEFLSRQEVLHRRLQRVKQLRRLYIAQYWILMEEVKKKHKEFYWLYGKSPFRGDEKKSSEERMNDKSLLMCQITDCKEKAMALTKFCHKHILHDTNQVLYRGCIYHIKGGQMCKKPVLRSINPPHCPTHAQAAEKCLARAFKREGLNVSSSSKLSPKLHVLVAEYVRHIQGKRRAALGKAVSRFKLEEKIK